LEFKSATTLPLIPAKQGVRSAETVPVTEAEAVGVGAVALGEAVVGEIVPEAEIVAVAVTVELVSGVGSEAPVEVGRATVVNVGRAVEKTAGATVGEPVKPAAAGSAVTVVCAEATCKLTKGVGDSLAAGRIVVSIGGRCPQAKRTMARASVNQRVGEKRIRANDIAQWTGTFLSVFFVWRTV
jgi:hypothetical protein